MVTQFLYFGIARCLGYCEARPSFSQMPKVRVHVEKNLLTCVLDGKCCLLLCQDALLDVMALLSPIPRLPSKQRSNSTYVLRKKLIFTGLK